MPLMIETEWLNFQGDPDHTREVTGSSPVSPIVKTRPKYPSKVPRKKRKLLFGFHDKSP
jgi:hypothetical protein